MDWITEGLNNLNYWLVLAGGVATMVIGYLWYSDMLFAKMWRKEVSMTKEQFEDKAGLAPIMVQATILALIAQSVLFAVLLASGTTELSDSIALAVMLGFGFSFTTIAVNNLYQRRSMLLTAIDGGYQIVALIAGAIIFALWG